MNFNPNIKLIKDNKNILEGELYVMFDDHIDIEITTDLQIIAYSPCLNIEKHDKNEISFTNNNKKYTLMFENNKARDKIFKYINLLLGELEIETIGDIKKILFDKEETSENTKKNLLLKILEMDCVREIFATNDTKFVLKLLENSSEELLREIIFKEKNFSFLKNLLKKEYFFADKKIKKNFKELDFLEKNAFFLELKRIFKVNKMDYEPIKQIINNILDLELKEMDFDKTSVTTYIKSHKKLVEIIYDMKKYKITPNNFVEKVLSDTNLSRYENLDLLIKLSEKYPNIVRNEIIKLKNEKILELKSHVIDEINSIILFECLILIYDQNDYLFSNFLYAKFLPKILVLPELNDFKNISETFLRNVLDFLKFLSEKDDQRFRIFIFTNNLLEILFSNRYSLDIEFLKISIIYNMLTFSENTTLLILREINFIHKIRNNLIKYLKSENNAIYPLVYSVMHTLPEN